MRPEIPLNDSMSLPPARRKPRMGVQWFLAGALAVTAAACWYWRIWDGGLRVPLAYGGDSLLYQSLARTVAKRQWYLTNPFLGAPGGQVLYDYPLGGDNLHFVVIRFLSVFTTDPIVLINAFYLLSFPLIFASAYYTLRRLAVSPFISTACGVVYTLAPYHFSRVGQVFLAAYYAVPLACLLLYDILSDAGFRGRLMPAASDSGSMDQRLGWRQVLRPRWIWIPIILASSGGYYALFFVSLAGAFGLLSAAYNRSIYRLVLPSVVAGLTLFVLFLNNAPTYAYQLNHGKNPVVAQRPPGSADTFALEWAYLLLPVEHHRLEPLARLRDKAQSASSSAGTVGSLSLGWVSRCGWPADLVGGGSRWSQPNFTCG